MHTIGFAFNKIRCAHFTACTLLVSGRHLVTTSTRTDGWKTSLGKFRSILVGDVICLSDDIHTHMSEGQLEVSVENYISKADLQCRYWVLST